MGPADQVPVPRSMREPGGPSDGSPPRDPGSPERTRIALVTPNYLPSLGGVERYVRFTGGLLRAWAEVRVFVPLRPAQDVPAPTGGGRSAGDLPVTRLPFRTLFGERVVPALELFEALQEFDPSLVWSHHPSVNADIAGLYARLKGCKWVATYHADLRRDKPYGPPYSRWESYLVGHADTVFTTTEHYRQKLIRRGAPGDRLVTLPTGPYLGDGVLPLPVATTVTEDAAPGPDHPLLFVGGLDAARSYKRPDLLVRAVHDLKARSLDVRLWIVGDGDRRPFLERLAAELGVGRSVEFLGRLGDEDLADRLRSAWALVLPSDSDAEGFGTICVEAITYGCPVVGSELAPGPKLVAERGAGVAYPVGDLSHLEAALERVWTDRALRGKLSARALTVSKEYQWPAIGPRLEGVIRRVLAA